MPAEILPTADKYMRLQTDDNEDSSDQTPTTSEQFSSACKEIENTHDLSSVAYDEEPLSSLGDAFIHTMISLMIQCRWIWLSSWLVASEQ